MTKKEKLLCVEWDDASSVDCWQARERAVAEDCRPYRCRTVGFLIAENEKSVLLAQSLSQNDKVQGSFQIPRTQIRKRTVLK